MDQTIKQLKTFRNIKPDEVYVRGSKALIFSASQDHPIFSGSHALVFGLPALATLAVAGFLIFRAADAPNASYASLDSKEIAGEISQIAIELDEIDYGASAERVIALAIAEISGDSGAHLNKTILEREQDLFKIEDERQPSEVDRLLNSVIF